MIPDLTSLVVMQLTAEELTSDRLQSARAAIGYAASDVYRNTREIVAIRLIVRIFTCASLNFCERDYILCLSRDFLFRTSWIDAI